MKKIFLLFFLLYAHTGHTQIPGTMYKIIAGPYTQGSTGGIYLFEDRTFALYGYATLVFGQYTLEGNEVRLTPTLPKAAFTVLGRENKSLGKGMKITFSRSVGEGRNYIGFDEGPLTEVFEAGMNTGYPHYKMEFDRKSRSLTLVETDAESMYPNNTTVFTPDPHFNDFLLFYNESNQERRPFSAHIETDKNPPVLRTDYGEFEKDTSADREEDLSFIVDIKKASEGHENDSLVYFNDQLKGATGHDELSEEASSFNPDNYVLDAASNKLIRKDVYRQGTDYRDALVQDYHDESIMLRYQTVNPVRVLQTLPEKMKIKSGALFPEGKDR